PGADRHAQPQCMGTLRLSDSDRGRGARRGALQGMVLAGTRRTRGKRGIAALALFAVDTAHYSVPSLVLFGAITVLYLVAGRREAIFDGLPVLVALASA